MSKYFANFEMFVSFPECVNLICIAFSVFFKDMFIVGSNKQTRNLPSSLEDLADQRELISYTAIEDQCRQPTVIIYHNMSTVHLYIK